jgi:Na+-transporting methylmalonyl-CoA/oxaloacetate decarboxylase gamma subunit
MSLFLTSPLAAVGASSDSSMLERIEEGLMLMAVGMSVVFAALVLIGVLIWLMSAAIRRIEERQQATLTAAQDAAARSAEAAKTAREAQEAQAGYAADAAEAAKAAAQSAPVAAVAQGGTAYPQRPGVDNTGAGMDSRTLVLISAAVAAVVGSSAHIRRITRVSQNATVSAWTDAGRYGLHSHNIRR